MSKPPVNERHARWITQVEDLIGDIQYVAGPENVLAYLLSRPRGLLKSIKDEFPVVAGITWQDENPYVPPSEKEKQSKSYRRTTSFHVSESHEMASNERSSWHI